jgi:hypothetical protein
VSYGKSEGSGLGLAIAKKIVEDHGGEICLDGRSETGTSFRITIPLAIPPRSSPALSNSPTGMSGSIVRSVHTPGDLPGTEISED